MDIFTAGQKIYRAFVDSEHGASTVEFEVVSIHIDYMKITAEWNADRTSLMPDVPAVGNLKTGPNFIVVP